MLGRPLSRRDALGAALSGAALLGFAPEAFADMAKTEAELTEADRMAAKIREKDATFIQPGKNRNNIKVPKAIRKLKAPKITFPASTADLEDYTLTPSGLYVQELVVGDEAGESPSSGKVQSTSIPESPRPSRLSSEPPERMALHLCAAESRPEH